MMMMMIYLQLPETMTKLLKLLTTVEILVKFKEYLIRDGKHLVDLIWLCFMAYQPL